MMTQLFLLLVTFTVTLTFTAANSPEDDSAGDARRNPVTEKQAAALRPFNALIGSWRGVGQLQRGSRKGAWTEKILCEWQFEPDATTVVLKAEKGRQFEKLKLSWDEKKKQIVLRQSIGDVQREYRGTMPREWPARIQLLSSADADGISWRCTIQQLTDIRSTLLFERRTSATGSFRRIAGIGYTRSGARLAHVGGNQRKCVVTGGLGTIPVKFKGETFYVCCQGCVLAFNDDPETIIAEYRASLKKK